MEDGNTVYIKNHQQWDHNDILKWIMSLENGLFLTYEDILKKSLEEGNVNGKVLNQVEPLFIKAWGIKDFVHQKALYEHIQSLTNIEGK